MKAPSPLFAAILACVVFCILAGEADGVVVESPALDRTYLVTNPQTLDKVVDLEQVFSGQDHLYGVSLDPEGVFEVELKGNGEVDVHTDGTFFGTVEVTVTAEDTSGGFASDTFKLTLRPRQMFVDANSPAPLADQDGATWQTAYQHLQDALLEAVEDQEIWVAEGVYYPDVDANGDSGLRSRAFQMVKKIPMYGGFAGGETTLEERRPRLHLTVLSGDIDQDDLQQPIASHVTEQSGDENNSYRVVDMSLCDDDDILDGFVITAGRADLAPDHLDGGGLFSFKDVRIENCWITGNYAENGGGGLYIFDDKPMIVNCRVNGNLAGNAGGGIYARKGGARLFNCEMRGNEALVGGGLFLEDPDLDLVNCLIAGNCGLTSGGGIHIEDGKLAMVNSTVSGNYTEGTGGGVKLVTAGGNPKIRNTIIFGNEAEGSTTSAAASIHIDDLGEAPKFRSCLVENSGGSEAWNGSAGIDEGGNIDLKPLFLLPLDPSPRPNDMGLYRLRGDSPGLDAGLWDYLLQDKADLDRDDDEKERISVDLSGEDRLLEAEVDLGAFEFDPFALLDSDGDGLSDDFELLHTGDPLVMEALSDQDGDWSSALGEFVSGKNPKVGGEGPLCCMATIEHLGETYQTITFEIDPVALNFATCAVLRRGGDHVPTVPWMENETIMIFAKPSPANPELLQVTHRSLYPIGAVETEFLRVRFQSILGGM